MEKIRTNTVFETLKLLKLLETMIKGNEILKKS